MKFTKHKCKNLHQWKYNPAVQHRLGSPQLGSSSVERDLGALVDKQLNRSEQHATAVAKEAKRMHHQGHPQQRQRQHCPNLLSTCQATPGILSSVLVLTKQNRCGQMKRAQRWATKVMKGLGSLAQEERQFSQPF